MADEREQLDAVLPREPRHIMVAGVDVTIHPITVIQIPALLDILEGLKSVPPLAKDRPLLPFLIRHAAVPLMAFTTLVTGRSQEWIGNLPLDEGMKLYGAVIEEHADFFVERLLPAVNALMPGLRRLAALWGGLQSSPASSEADTASPTFTDIR
jgi:hypothetical protein